MYRFRISVDQQNNVHQTRRMKRQTSSRKEKVFGSKWATVGAALGRSSEPAERQAVFESEVSSDKSSALSAHQMAIRALRGASLRARGSTLSSLTSLRSFTWTGSSPSLLSFQSTSCMLRRRVHLARPVAWTRVGVEGLVKAAPGHSLVFSVSGDMEHD